MAKAGATWAAASFAGALRASATLIGTGLARALLAAAPVAAAPLAGALLAGTLLAATPLADAPLAAQGLGDWSTDFTQRAVPLEQFVAGGPPKDGIPAIDHPRFVDLDEADDWLGPREPVAVVSLGGETRVYPLQILIFHEIVNDEVGGVPVTVTFCPLCNTTLAFDRRLDDRLLDFGVSGFLRNSDLVMYDRQTESWWQQATGEALVGSLTGRRLTALPAPVLSWSEVQREYPDARVLSRDTGYRRPYGANPYRGYDSRPGPMRGMVATPSDDDRLRAMDRVVAIDEGTPPVAIPFEALEQRRVVGVVTTAGRRVVFWTPETASALDRTRIADGRGVGSVAVYASVWQGRALAFEPAGDGRFRDRETGSVWTVAGRAVEGELAGAQLEPVAHSTPFWFAWVAFRPDTNLWGR